MRISIWQQYSSNHSGGFEVVGIFKNANLAHNAAELLRQKFRAIAQDRAADKDSCHDCPPTRAELELALQYSIRWVPKSIDWLILDGEDVRNISQLDQFVFVSNLGFDNTWMGAEPIDRLMQAIGGQVLATDELDVAELNIDIKCQAPDEARALNLFEQIYTYWQVARQYKDDPIKNTVLSPWINFWKGGEWNLANIWTLSVEDLVKKYLAEKSARKQYIAEHAAEADRLTWKMIQAQETGNLARRDELANERWHHVNYIPPTDVEQLSSRQSDNALRAIYATAFIGEISRSGQELFINLHLYGVGQELPALVDFLKFHGCTDIQYKMSLIPIAEE